MACPQAVIIVHYQDFMDSLEGDSCPDALEPCLRALWYDASDDWHRAHDIVQQQSGRMAARIHAYLHRKEGDDWNSRYWHRQAGSVYPQHMSLDEEWDCLVRELLDQ